MASKLKQPTFETDRLRLRPFRANDAKALHALYGDAENLRYWGTDPSPDLDSTRKALRWHISFHPFQYALWAIEEKKSRKLIGMINYHRRDLIGHLVGKLKVHKVEALIRADNKPSIALAKRLGFRLEGGPIRDRWLKDGTWHSVMLYGLIAGEER